MEVDDHPTEFSLRLLEPEDALQARALILDGLAERWGELDMSKVPDLENLVDSYRHGAFLVACEGRWVIGTGAIVPEAPGTGRIVRMWVRPEHRREGVGSAILYCLLQEAVRREWREVVLETTATWQDAVQFYRRSGFTSQGIRRGDHHFRLTIG
jgi:ribosomal protein S18 acetylase RimI-like enzyme